LVRDAHEREQREHVDRPHNRRARAEPRHGRYSRGRRDQRAVGSPTEARLRERPGLLLLEARQLRRRGEDHRRDLRLAHLAPAPTQYAARRQARPRRIEKFLTAFYCLAGSTMTVESASLFVRSCAARCAASTRVARLPLRT